MNLTMEPVDHEMDWNDEPTDAVTDPNVTLDWGTPEPAAYVEGVRETDMTVKVIPDQTYPTVENFAIDLAVMGENISDYVVENFRYLVESDEIVFQESCAQLYRVIDQTKQYLGDLCWSRLKHQLGFMLASESEERNSLVSRWCIKIGCDYYRLNNYIIAAKTRELVPETADMSITAQSELGRNAGEGEDEQREVIKERAESVKKLDPEGTNTTATAREVKALEANGNKLPNLYKMRDLSEFRHTDDEIVMGQIKTGEAFDAESGAYEDVYEYKPIVGLYWYMPDTGEHTGQFENYKKMLLRRLGVKTA